ncbi:MAG: PAS domain-containing protein, partial [Desulfobacteraceae bacterium]|nr:PAS domain-containing protein [Desulfobacteraceae bacterium]
MKLPNKEMETILNGIRDFILIISPEKEIIEVNAAFLRHMNYKRGDVIGRKCFNVFKEVTRKSSNCHQFCPLEDVIKNKRHCQVELTRLGSDDKPKYTELTIFPIWEKKGKISKFIEISRDITKRKMDEKKNQQHLVKMVEERTRQLQETHEKLLHQNKMASLGKLSSAVVH